MKLGILTFHSQLNYGGVLQCWALKQALTRLLKEKGKRKSEKQDEVVVVDRWLDEKNAVLRGALAGGWKGWAKLFIRGLLGCGDFGKLLRTIRTIRFVRGLGLTKAHFYRWEELGCGGEGACRPTIAGEDLDLLVVGSDQVWHGGDWGDPRPYLLEGAPEMRAIAYAASFGLKELPKDMRELYRRGLGRFSAISCREQEGVEICRGLGFAAAHVVDPTLLVGLDDWRELVGGGGEGTRRPTTRTLVCYFIDVDLKAAMPELERFAAEQNCHVEVLSNDSFLLPLPRSASAFAEKLLSSRVKICRGYGPKEFVRALSRATWTLSDSFHAAMFSAIFSRNMRFLRPANDLRRVMFARVEEFAEKCIEGEFFVDDVRQALSSFASGEVVAYNRDQISAMRAESLKWIECHVDK